MSKHKTTQIRFKGFVGEHNNNKQSSVLHVASRRRGRLGCRWGPGNSLAIFVTPPKIDTTSVVDANGNNARIHGSSSFQEKVGGGGGSSSFQEKVGGGGGGLEKKCDASTSGIVERQWNVFPRQTRKLIQDGLRIFCEVQRGEHEEKTIRRFGEGRGGRESFQSKLKRCSTMYLKSIRKSAESVSTQGRSVLRTKLLISATCWHLSQIFFFGETTEDATPSRAKRSSISMDLVEWLRENFFAAAEEEEEDLRVMFDPRYASGAILEDSWDTTKWETLWRFLIHGQWHLAFKALRERHPSIAKGNVSPALAGLVGLLRVGGHGHLSGFPVFSPSRVETWRSEVSQCLDQARAEPETSEKRYVIDTLRLLLGDDEILKDICNTWQDMFCASLLFKFPNLQRHEFLPSRNRNYTADQRGRRCFQACVETMCGRANRQEVRLYSEIAGQNPQAPLDMFRWLGMPWMAAHMADLLAHAKRLPPLPPASKESQNLVASLGGSTCGHAQRALLVEEFVESIAGDSDLWQIAATYALGMETECGKGREYLVPSERRHVQALLQLILERAPVHTEVAATRAYNFAQRLQQFDASCSLGLSRAMCVRRANVGSGNCGRWLLHADAFSHLNTLAMELLNDCVVSCRSSFDPSSSTTSRATGIGTSVDGPTAMKRMHALLAAVAMRPSVLVTFGGLRTLHNLQQFLLVESDIQRSGFRETIVVSESRGEETQMVSTCLHNVAAKHLAGILSDDGLPLKFVWPALCMAMPYLRLRSFAKSELYVLMDRLTAFMSEWTVSSSSSGMSSYPIPHAFAGSVVASPASFKKLGVNSSLSKRPFVQAFREEAAHCLSDATLVVG
eukprot:g4017.t1